MKDNLRTQLVNELSTKFPGGLVEDLISSYEKVLIEYRKGAWDETLWKAGKFVENAFRLLHYVVHSIVLEQVPSVTNLKEELEKSPSSRFSESVRILIPRIATALIYDPRSKKGAVHVKAVNPDYLDATLVVSACDWIVAELIRTYNTDDTERIQQIVKSIVARKIPFVEKYGEERFVTVPLGLEDEILLLLLDSGGMERTSIGKSLLSYYAPPRITEALASLIKKRFVVLCANGNYVATGPGESAISKVLSKLG